MPKVKPLTEALRKEQERQKFIDSACAEFYKIINASLGYNNNMPLTDMMESAHIARSSWNNWHSGSQKDGMYFKTTKMRDFLAVLLSCGAKVNICADEPGKISLEVRLK